MTAVLQRCRWELRLCNIEISLAMTAKKEKRRNHERSTHCFKLRELLLPISRSALPLEARQKHTTTRVSIPKVLTSSISRNKRIGTDVDIIDLINDQNSSANQDSNQKLRNTVVLSFVLISADTSKENLWRESNGSISMHTKIFWGKSVISFFVTNHPRIMRICFE